MSYPPRPCSLRFDQKTVFNEATLYLAIDQRVMLVRSRAQIAGFQAVVDISLVAFSIASATTAGRTRYNKHVVAFFTVPNRNADQVHRVSVSVMTSCGQQETNFLQNNAAVPSRTK